MEIIIAIAIGLGITIFGVEYQKARIDERPFQSPAVQGHPYLSHPKITSEGRNEEA